MDQNPPRDNDTPDHPETPERPAAHDPEERMGTRQGRAGEDVGGTTPGPDVDAAVAETRAAGMTPDLGETEPAGNRALLGGVVAVLAVAILVLAYLRRAEPVSGSHYLLLSLLLFTAGSLGVLVRRNALVLFMCIELMLNAVNIAFVTFARMHGVLAGQVIVLFVMIVAAAEVAVGLAIIVSIFRRRLSANVDDLNALRW